MTNNVTPLKAFLIVAVILASVLQYEMGLSARSADENAATTYSKSTEDVAGLMPEVS
jgi:hypothetical protein